jgi:hypothetical protein
METEHVDLQMELHKMKDELAHLTEQFAQQQAVKEKDHRREMKTLQNQLNEYQISERTQELEHCRADLDDIRKKTDALRVRVKNTELEASTKTCVGAARYTGGNLFRFPRTSVTLHLCTSVPCVHACTYEPCVSRTTHGQKNVTKQRVPSILLTKTWGGPHVAVPCCRTAAALVSQMRSQLQDKILLLMGANIVSHMTAHCAGMKVPSLDNLTEFQTPQCSAFKDSTSIRTSLLEQKLEDMAEMKRTPDDTQQEFMLRSLLSAKQALTNNDTYYSQVRGSTLLPVPVR